MTNKHPAQPGHHMSLFWRLLKKILFLASCSFWRLLAFLGLWPHHPGLCLRGHLVFSSICVKSALLL